MPRNIILPEIDRTGSISEVTVSNTVFIPIHTTSSISPTLCTSEADLKDAFKANLVTDDDSLEYSPGLGYRLARYLIRNGLSVLAQGVTGTTDSAPTIDWTALQDKNLYDIRFLTYGAFKVGVSQDMINCAATRGDCVALVNFNETESNFSYALSDIGELTKNIQNGEYAAAFIPAFYTKDVDLLVNDETKTLIPAAFGYLLAYARSIRTNPEWYAVAGFERGVIPELYEVKHVYSTAEVNALQKRSDDPDDDNVGIAVNAIAYIRPAGNIIYGNRTLKNNDGKLTATSFLNVRNMMSVVKKVAYEAANRFIFEQNSDVLWVNYKSYIEPTLDRITHSNGALGYSINRIKTNTRALMKAEIIIQPIEAVEDIELSVVMTDNSTVVNE